MAFIRIEGFDDEATETFFPVSAATTDFSAVAGPNSRGMALQYDGDFSNPQFVIGSGGLRRTVIGFRHYLPSHEGTGDLFLRGRSDGTNDKYYGVNLSGTGLMTSNSSNMGTSPWTTISEDVPMDEWSYWEFDIDHVVTSTPTMEVYRNGVSFASLTGQGPGTFNALSEIQMSASDHRQGERWDDLYVWSHATDAPTGFPFGSRLQVNRRLPDATGALTDWGGAYTDVDDDDPTASTGTSVSSTTSTDQASYSIEASPSSLQSILAVQFDVWGQGSVNLEPLYRTSGGSVGTDTTNLVALPATYGGARAILEQNPQSAADWTPGELNTGEFGFELE